MRRIVGPSLDLTSYSYKNIPNGAGKIIGSVARESGRNSIDLGDRILAPTIVCPNISVPGLVINGMEGEMKDVDEKSIARNLSASDALVEQLNRRNRDTIASMEQGPKIEDTKEITAKQRPEGTRRILPDITTR
jgi:hypothetical protein